MWSVVDDDTPVVPDKMCGLFIWNGQMEYKIAAKALHVAVNELRARVGMKEF